MSKPFTKGYRVVVVPDSRYGPFEYYAPLQPHTSFTLMHLSRNIGAANALVNFAIVEGRYTEYPSDLLVLEYTGRRVGANENLLWRIVEDD